MSVTGNLMEEMAIISPQVIQNDIPEAIQPVHIRYHD